MEVHDLVTLQNEFKSYKTSFCLWPKSWDSINDIGPFNWEICPFDNRYVDKIPSSPGIYSFVINPGVTNHPQRYLCYIGKSDRTLKERYWEYLREAKRIKGRPKLLYLLNNWASYLEFCYVTIEDGNLRDLEKRLIDAFIPPFNSDFSTEINRVVKAFN
jgi:excinuclease UvrABC nuclease subunit